MPSNCAGRQLNRVAAIFNFGQAQVRVGGDAQSVGGIQLELYAREGSGEDPVGGHQGGIDGGGYQVARVATTHGDVAIDETHPRYAAAGHVFGLRIRRIGRVSTRVVLGDQPDLPE